MSSWVCVRREELPAANGLDRAGEEEAGREAAPGGALAHPARDRGIGAPTGRRVPAAHQRRRNRCGTGMKGLCDAGTRGERVPHSEARSGVVPGLTIVVTKSNRSGP